MPRAPRVEFPGAVHHAYARGIEKREIFFDDQDRHAFLARVGENLPRWRIRCAAWALMPNHFHMLVQSECGQLPSFMRCLLTGYAKYFNDRHERVGHLFQNRYMTRLVRKDSHLQEAIRYIHLNPLRAGLVTSLESLDRYPWTGHRRIMGAPQPDWHNTTMIRDLFSLGPGDDRWKESYRSFLEPCSSVLGEVEKIEAKKERDDESEARSATPSVNDPGVSPDGIHVILDRISYWTGIPRERIVRGRKYAEVRARRQLLLEGVSRMEVPVSRICRWLGIEVAAGEYLVRTAGRARRTFQERP